MTKVHWWLWWIIHDGWKVVKQSLWKLYVWKNLIFCTPCFYFPGALCLSWWWEHVTSLPQGGEARKRLIAVLAVFSLGNDKQFGGTPLSQIESLQTNCNCQIAQFRTIRRFYPAAKRQHKGKNRFSDRKFWTSKLPRWWLFYRTGDAGFVSHEVFRACYLLQHSPVQHVIWSSRVVRSCIRVWRLVKSCIRVWMLARSSKRHKPEARCAFIYNRIQLDG